MLILSRKQQESIQISNNVFVTVLEIRGTSVRIGIDAPREIPVLRTELLNRVVFPARQDSRSEANMKVPDNFRANQAWETEGDSDE